jgi:hypothetical protein
MYKSQNFHFEILKTGGKKKQAVIVQISGRSTENPDLSFI